MSDVVIQPASAAGTGLSQIERVTNIFTAPSKTFEDIMRGNKSWWLPLILLSLFTYVLFAGISMKVGWGQVADNITRMDPKSSERMEQATPEQRESIVKFTKYSIEGSFVATPVIILLTTAVMSLGLWGTINLVFGGKARYGSIFTVWLFASLPTIIQSLLGTAVLFAGAAPESFNIKNFAPTNLGAFLNPVETNRALYLLATKLDAVTIWTLVLLSIGTAIVAGVKRSSAYIAVFGWWAIFVLIGVGWAVAFS